METLIGNVYGEWTVVAKSQKKYYLTCLCSCGVIKDVNISSLKLGKSKSCGHGLGSFARDTNYSKSDKKYLGKRFGRLVVLQRASNKGRSSYLCQCDCGNTPTISLIQLTSGKTKSCGCIKSETASAEMSKIKKAGVSELRKADIDGSNIYSLQAKTPKNNKTGYKGISQLKNGKYRAYINVAKKQIYLGLSSSLQEAVLSRKEAEKKIINDLQNKLHNKKPHD